MNRPCRPQGLVDTPSGLWYNNQTTGCSAARQRAAFGTLRPEVQILSPRLLFVSSLYVRLGTNCLRTHEVMRQMPDSQAGGGVPPALEPRGRTPVVLQRVQEGNRRCHLCGGRGRV